MIIVELKTFQDIENKSKLVTSNKQVIEQLIAAFLTPLFPQLRDNIEGTRPYTI